MELKPLLEAVLFVAEEPLTADKMAEITGAAVRDVRCCLDVLQNEYKAADRGLQVMSVARGYQLATKPEAAGVAEKLSREENRYTLSQAALETLGIIAYRQPVTRIDIEAVRGVKVDGVLDTLLKRRFIRVAGRKDVPGRPLLYGTTKEFLRYFGLKDLSELPRPVQGDDGKHP
ncbi:MAG: Segregation and condensation protein B [Syntrophomonadaceae bacterium]|nr:Segregation and condensation protein B [Bacillota bacterium]